MAKLGGVLIPVGIYSDKGQIRKEFNKMYKEFQRTGRRMALTGRELTGAVTLPIVGMGTAAVKAFMDIEKLRLGLDRVAGSAGAGAAQYAKLRKLALRPGIGFEEAVKGAIRIQSLGESFEYAEGVLGGLANAISASAGGRVEFDRALNQITQSLAKGKVEMQDWKIISENASAATRVMAEQFGTADLELARAGVSAKEFWQIMSVGFAQLGQGPETFANKWENFNMELKENLALVGELIVDSGILQVGMESIVGAISSMARWFGKLSPIQKKFIIGIVGAAAATGPLLILWGNMRLLLAPLVSGMSALASVMVVQVGPAIVSVTKLTQGLMTTLKGAASLIGVILTASWLNKSLQEASVTEISGMRAWMDRMNAQNKGYKGSNIMGSEAADRNTKRRQMLDVAGGQLKQQLVGANPMRMGSARYGPFSGGYRIPGETQAEIKAAEEAAKIAAKKFHLKLHEEMRLAKYMVGLSDAIKDTFGDAYEAAQDGLLGSRQTFNVKKIATGLGKVGFGALDRIKNRKNMPKGNIPETGLDKISRIGGGIIDMAGMGLSQLGAIFDQFFQNKMQRLENYYQKEYEMIMRSTMTEEQKQKAILKLEEKTERERAKLAKKKAKRDKALAIFNATITGAQLVLQAALAAAPLGIGIGVAAGIAGALVAAQLGAIAAAPVPLAKGGIASSTQYAMVGEYPGARTNPEVIAPLDKLKQYINPAGEVKVSGHSTIAGSHLYIMFESENRSRRSSGAPYYPQEF